MNVDYLAEIRQALSDARDRQAWKVEGSRHED